MQRWAARSGDALAIEFESQKFTYAELVARVEVCASGLMRRGVGEGDRVAWLGPNRPTSLELLLACARLGAMLLPLNSRLTVPEHAWILDDAEPKLLLCDAAFADHGAAAVASSAAGTGNASNASTTGNPDTAGNTGTTGNTDGASGIGEAGGFACEVVPDLSAFGTPDANNSTGAGADASTIGTTGVEPMSYVGTPDHAVLLAYTSGTTGHPKGAVLTQGALAANAINSTHAHDLTRLDRVLTVIPMFHVGGLNIQTLPALLGGAAVLIHRSFDPGLLLDDVERWRPTWTVLVPAALQAVSAHPRFDEADLSSLRGIMTGSSPIPPAVTQPYFERGLAVGEIYGATETAPICVHIRPDEAADHPYSCGKPSTLCEVRLAPIGTDGTGSVAGELAPGESGEIWVRAPSVMREYWRNPEASSAALVDGWYRTGDVAHVDADGWLYVDDRLTDMIISGGENIYPAELEEHLSHCPVLAEAVVLGRPDERWGEVPIVIAVANNPNTDEQRTDNPNPANPNPNEQRTAIVLDHLRTRVARFKLPVAVIWTDALPRTALGKVQKAILRERFTK